MWQNEDYNRLTDKDKENFTRVTNRLLSESFILRQQFDPRENAFKINKDYRFIEHHKELITDYLNIVGWDMRIDDSFGVVRIRNTYEFNRVRLNKVPTYLLYTLRLIYEEEQERVSSRSNMSVSTTVADIHHKLRSLNLLETKLGKRELEESLSQIKSFNIIDKLDETWSHPDCRIIIYPSIIFIVPNEKIHTLTNQAETTNEEDIEIEDLQETTLD